MTRARSRASSVDLTGPQPGRVPPIAFDYRPSAGTEENDGHEIAVELDDAGSITTFGETYHLVGYHFHTPSEHLVDGEPSAAELHLVHKTPGRSDRGARCPAHRRSRERGARGDLLEGPAGAGRGRGARRRGRPAGIAARGRPRRGLPVRRLAEASARQLDAVAAAYGDDARPAQPLGERTIMLGRPG